MAFGLTKSELVAWKKAADNGEIAFLTHYWKDERFPGCSSVTKVACTDLEKLKAWGEKYGLKAEWIDMHRKYPHFDLFGEEQKKILLAEGIIDQIAKFNL